MADGTPNAVVNRLKSGEYLRVPRNGMPDYVHFGWDDDQDQLVHRIGGAPVGHGDYSRELLEWVAERRRDKFEFVDASETRLPTDQLRLGDYSEVETVV